MLVFSHIQDTKKFLHSQKKQAKSIGFVPTMGALHQGHLSLIERAKRDNDLVVASIFVNPLQFNDKKDLERYPRTLDSDTEKLRRAGCDVLFAPAAGEMYPETNRQLATGSWQKNSRQPALDLGMLDKVMEGKQRPGHFQGVCIVVQKLFDIIEPDRAYFGEKDYQQLTIVKYMVRKLNIPVEIIACPTLREPDGLAMSSRNALLGPEERKNAGLIYKTLMEVKAEAKAKVEELKKIAEERINANPFLKLEYFELADAETLLPVTTLETIQNVRAFIAVKAGSVRLIDNISLPARRGHGEGG